MLWFIFLYVLLQLGIAYVVSRNVSTEEDYLVGSRSFGFLLSTFTLFATWFGAETCIGAAGRAYKGSLSDNAADPFGYALCLLFMGFFFARRIWNLKLFTLGDLYARSYGKTAERVAVLLMVPTSVLWAAAQIRAFGLIVAHSSNFPQFWAVTFAAAIVIFYTTFGGFKADVVTDLIQGFVLMLGLGLMFLFIVNSTEGGILLFEKIPESKWQWAKPGLSWMSQLESWAIPICGSVFAAELIPRISGAQSAKVSKYAAITAGFIYLAFGCAAVILGLLGTHLLPGLESPEQILVALAAVKLPAWAYALFAGALVSAILSTVDSSLLTAGSLFAHNLILPMTNNFTPKQKLRLNRSSVMGFGLIAYLLAIGSESVYGLVEEASAFGSAGVFVTCLFALLYRGQSKKLFGSFPAVIALILGAFVHALGAHILHLDFPYLLALLFSSISFIGAAFVCYWYKSPKSSS